ncbi:MAG: glycosyltransferase family A protein [Chloroflexia bacterium]
MRIGSYSAKEDPALRAYGHHRIVVPVYIPNLEGYFAQSLDVLKVCLESLHRTADAKARITAVSNGSAPEVVAELRRQLDLGVLDQLLLNGTNRGKVDAVVSVARGCFEPFITITDCDVLFRTGWLEAVERVFLTFPEAGFVSPAPTPNAPWYFTSATVLDSVVRRELRLEKVIDDADLDLFEQSIGWAIYKPEERQAQYVVRRGEGLACVGSGHFVFTIRKEVVRAMPEQPSQQAVGGISEVTWLDAPADALGLWRLATPKTFAYHIGNVLGPWVYEELAACAPPQEDINHFEDGVPHLRRSRISRLPWVVRRGLVRALRKTPLRSALPKSLGDRPALPAKSGTERLEA